MPATAYSQNANQSRKTTFLEFREHRLCEVSKTKHDDEFIEKIVQNPSTKEDIVKYYKFYRDVSGTVTDLKWIEEEDTKYNHYRMTLTDAFGEVFIIKFPYGNKDILDKFLKTIGNVNFEKTLKIQAFPSDKKTIDGDFVLDKNGNKKVETALVFYQENEFGEEKALKRFWVKANFPKEFEPVPPAPKAKEKKWDFSAYYGFLCEKCDELIANTTFAKVEAPKQTDAQKVMNAQAPISSSFDDSQEIPF